MTAQRTDLGDALRGAIDSWQEFPSELRGVSEDDFAADPGNGEWSIKRQVEHSIGSEIYFASLIEHALGGSGRSWERDRLTQLLDRVRQETLRRVLEIPEEELDRPHTHPDEGEYTIRDVITGPLARHPRMHLEYVQKVRQLLQNR
jgi:hypothetical protein